jgi:hypothetical protein
MKRKLKYTFFIVILIFASSLAIKWFFWSKGSIVAKAEKGKDFSKYTLIVREIPPDKHPLAFIHFLIDKDLSKIDERYTCELRWNHIVVTSCTFFWDSVRPEKIDIIWEDLHNFTIVFDKLDVVKCNWSYGGYANWSRGHSF